MASSLHDRRRDTMEHIKANFPATQADYASGNGEGMFVLVDDETKAAHDTDATGGGYSGILDNDSCYWRGLEHGERVPLEMRGDKRPVCPFEWLNGRFELNG